MEQLTWQRRHGKPVPAVFNIAHESRSHGKTRGISSIVNSLSAASGILDSMASACPEIGAEASRVALRFRSRPLSTTQRRISSYLFALACAVGCAAVWAQTKEFPVRPVRVVVPVPPGGSLDVMARILAPKWGELMGQNVIIDYRPGANTIVGSEHVARAPRRRLHAAHQHAAVRRESGAVSEDAFRYRARFRAGLAAGVVAVRARRASIGAREIGEGADRARESAPGQAQLLVVPATAATCTSQPSFSRTLPARTSFTCHTAAAVRR